MSQEKSKFKPLPTRKFLQECFEYDPVLGCLFWKLRPLNHFGGSICVWKNWNARFKGKRAGYLHPHGYEKVSINQEVFYVHRIIHFLATGEEGTIIDHINRDSKDNRAENLRGVTHSQNLLNTRIPKNNTSGAKGVYFHKRTGKYSVYSTINGKRVTKYGFQDLASAEKYQKDLASNNFFGGISC